ncbi:MAG TPA: COQ9 family protein [Acetobacteraceae bacterium]|nr:COQ9 family protein [Acetobacteraceae bacterium]
MIAAPEPSPERDAAIRAMLPNVPLDGWTVRALAAGLVTLHEPPELWRNLFPNGPVDMFEAWCDLADREMKAAAAGPDGLGEGLGLAARVRVLVVLRFRQLRPHREAMRRGLSLLAGAGRLPALAHITARTVDSIWHTAGERATDFTWYTKRASLAAVYSATLLYWLADESEDEEATLAFFDRRLAGLAAFGRVRRGLSGAFPCLPRFRRSA